MLLALIIGGFVLLALAAGGTGWFCYVMGRAEGKLEERTHRAQQQLNLENARRESFARSGIPWVTHVGPQGAATFTPKATPRPDANTVANGFPAVPQAHQYPGRITIDEGWARHAADPAAAATKAAADYYQTQADYNQIQKARHAAASVNGHPYPQMIP